MNPYHFRISLQLRHPTRDLSFASVQFGLLSARHWVYGMQKTTIAGDPWEGVNDYSYWTSPWTPVIVYSVDQDLEEALDEAMNKLCRHDKFFLEFRDDGGSAYLSIGLFGPRNFGLEFSPELLGQLSDLGLKIGFDIYPGEPTDCQ